MVLWGSVERLLDFWNYLSKESKADANPMFKPWWDHLHNIDKAVATGEAAQKILFIEGICHDRSTCIFPSDTNA